MNDRQRTILGVIAVFSLAGIAALSLLLMDRSGGISTEASEEPAVIATCSNNPKVADNGVEVEVETKRLIVKTTEAVPGAIINISLSGVTSPVIDGWNVAFVRSGNIYSAQLDLGAVAAQRSVEIPLSYTYLEGQKHCLTAAPSADGFAFPLTASLSF